MNTRLVNTAAKVIAAAMEQGKRIPATLAMALESAQLLQSPETVAEHVQAKEYLTGARLSLWEEEQDNARLRLALASAKRGRRELRSRVAELEARLAEAERPVDGYTRKFAPVLALREDTPSHTAEGSPAARLARRLRTQPDVQAIDVIDDGAIRVTIHPQTLDCWRWWQARFNVDAASATSRGSLMTATGRHDGVTVHFAALGVPALIVDAVKGRDDQ
ncbi:hypothetical protein [Streptomyces cyslabdanicus]|uniref:hypothetical protein n=1 Tax=Streptomyces cyslabdanicus TaxID=1470456 RepID=UPI0040443D61